MQLGAEGGFELRGGAVDRDPGSASGDGGNGESFGLQPRRDLIDIGLRDAEAVGELFGSEPALVIGRAGCLLIGEKFFEIGFLRGGLSEREGDVGDFSRWGEAALFEFGPGFRMNVPGEGDALRAIDRAMKARRLRRDWNC